jgi:hypothetical protein
MLYQYERKHTSGDIWIQHRHETDPHSRHYSAQALAAACKWQFVVNVVEHIGDLLTVIGPSKWGPGRDHVKHVATR